jgi:hypothetical protein
MSSGIPNNAASMTATVASGSMTDPDGIKTSFATSTSAVVLTFADWNGVAISAVDGRITVPGKGLGRTVTITRSNNANQFSVVPFTIEGVRGGRPLSVSLTPANINGNDILQTEESFDYVTRILIPIQGGTGGTFTIGVQDICAPAGARFSGVEVAAAGTLYMQYGEGFGCPTDALPIATAQVGVVKPVAPSRILTGTGETTVGVTLYL